MSRYGNKPRIKGNPGRGLRNGNQTYGRLTPKGTPRGHMRRSTVAKYPATGAYLMEAAAIRRQNRENYKTLQIEAYIDNLGDASATDELLAGNIGED